MSAKQPIPFLVEEVLDERGIRAAAPAVLQQVVGIEPEMLRRNISELLQGICDVLSHVDLQKSEFSLEEVRLALHVTAAGEVSIISLAKGSVGGQVGLEVTLTPKKAPR